MSLTTVHPRRTRLGLIEATWRVRVIMGYSAAHPRRTRLGLIEARDARTATRA